jgi:hypothetical protein
LDRYVVASDGESGERVEALAVGCGLMLNSGFDIGCVYAGIRDHSIARIPDHARDAAANPSP